MNDKLLTLSRDVLLLSRNTLLVNLRFLDMALSQFELVPSSDVNFATDGKHIFFNPKYILKRYTTKQNVSAHDYLHLVMHCVFRHMYVDPSINRDIWNVACDIAVENIINDLDISAADDGRRSSQTRFIHKVQANVKQMTAEKIYAYLKSNYNQNEIASMQPHFYADDHSIWYAPPKDKNADSQSSETTSQKQSSNSQSNEITSQQATYEVWKDIAERMQVDMEMFREKQQGIDAGYMIQNLAAVNRQKYDYTEFLKKFAVIGEAMKLNDDEFDYIFYTYGLNVYKNMPLIEPLEYKDIKAIREFVIAIDTSGSTSGALVQKFVEKTYNILKSTESFFRKINLHIIQCDTKIHEDKKITCQEEFDEYLETMKLHGFGGTDFRPVFEYVDELILKKEFSNLKGLIYFTDGYGTFPSKKPNYNTAFVFIDDEYNNPDVPPWAIKLVLQSDEI